MHKNGDDVFPHIPLEDTAEHTTSCFYICLLSFWSLFIMTYLSATRPMTAQILVTKLAKLCVSSLTTTMTGEMS